MAFSQRRRQTSSRSTPPHRVRGQHRAAGRHPRGRSPAPALSRSKAQAPLPPQPPFLLSASLAAAPAAADDAYIASQHGQLVVDAADGVLQNDTSTAASAGRLLISSFGADNDLVITARSAGAAAGNLHVRFLADRARQRRSLGRIHARSWRRVRPARCPPPDAHMGTGGLSSTSGDSVIRTASRHRPRCRQPVQWRAARHRRQPRRRCRQRHVEYDHAARTLHLWIDDATTTASSLEAAFRENASVNNAWQFDHYLRFRRQRPPDSRYPRRLRRLAPDRPGRRRWPGPLHRGRRGDAHQRHARSFRRLQRCLGLRRERHGPRQPLRGIRTQRPGRGRQHAPVFG